MAAAAELAREVARSDPGAVEALILWGVAALEAGDPVAALVPLRRALPKATTGPAAILLRLQFARALIASARWREGLEILEGIAGSPPEDAWLRHRLALGYLDAGRIAAALPHLRFASASRPDDPAVHADLGWALATQGSLPEAREQYERSIALAPDLGRAHAGLATLQRWSAADHHVDRLRAAFARADDPILRAELGYALFKELDDLDERDDAWRALAAAHAAISPIDPWSAAEDGAFAQSLIERFPARAFQRGASRVGVPTGSRPIFVLGLPRTGTTLVERILGIHSRVTGLGELPFFPKVFREALGGSVISPMNATLVGRARKADWRSAGASYRRETQALARSAPAFVDKLPFNSLLAGAIRLALPEALIVLVERDPMDVLWSAHRNPFQVGGWYGWTRRQEDLHAHYLDHLRLMNHWREVLGDDGLVTVRYEELARAPEATIPALLDRCGLTFEPACLRPDADPSAILTLSQASARQPISTGAIGSWKAYARHLEPLRAALETSGIPSS